jgi:hypothetical protein
MGERGCALPLLQKRSVVRIGLPKSDVRRPGLLPIPTQLRGSEGFFDRGIRECNTTTLAASSTAASPVRSESPRPLPAAADTRRRHLGFAAPATLPAR